MNPGNPSAPTSDATQPNEDSCDIAIVGGGAAGLMAGIVAGRELRKAYPDSRVVVLDGAKRVGSKILVSGGGRCNVTHDVVTPDDYTGPTRNQVKKVLATLTVEQTIAFFRELGVELKREDTGKLFPTTDAARTVLDALLRGLRDARVELREDHRVTAIELIREDDPMTHDHSRPTTSTRPPAVAPPHRFAIQHTHGTLHASRVILATGGKSLPKTGSDGFGYRLARALGHTVTDTWPALVPMCLPHGHWLMTLSGIALEVELTLTTGSGKIVHRQAGAMLATHFGISGPAPMDISRHRMAIMQTDPGYKLLANLTPGLTFEQIDQKLIEATTRRPKATILSQLPARLPERFARALLERELGIEPNTPLAHLPRDDRRAIARTLTALPLPIKHDRGYNHAEVTAGGVPLAEVELGTMASRVRDGLYLCGEILDCDGRIGGYNFQWAWCTGRLAGLAAAKACSASQATPAG